MTQVENHLGYFDRHPSHVIQLVGKNQLDKHQMYKIYILHPLGNLPTSLTFFNLVEDMNFVRSLKFKSC